MVDIEIVVPVYNEAAGLEQSIRRLHRFLSDGFPFSWQIVIADNASVDATPEIARSLALRLRGVRYLRLERKGRGRALRAAWSDSPARVVAYMDVDLSTDLRARFSDAQCGFKAVRRDALDGLLRDVRDEGWFFDTELLVLAQRRGLRIHEVPVDWVDDPDSRVDIISTALTDLRGVARLLAAGPIARFMGVGVLSTLAYALLYVFMHPALGAAGANAAALAITAVGNTAANRRLTFGLRGRAQLLRHHVRGAFVFALTLGLTNGALAVLHGLDAAPARALELSVLVAASLTATVTRYVALRTWVFAHGRRSMRSAFDRPVLEHTGNWSVYRDETGRLPGCGKVRIVRSTHSGKGLHHVQDQGSRHQHRSLGFAPPAGDG